MQVKYIYVKLKAVTPVHVGCAEVYEPTSFYIDRKCSELVHFDAGRFVEMLEEKDLGRLSSICRQGTPASIIELMRFIQKQSEDLNINGARISVCQELGEHYGKTLKISSRDFRRLKNEINQFQIMRSAYDPVTDRLYLPGSAIKGAVRTAVLNYRKNNTEGSFEGKKAGRRLQEAILGYESRNLESDPFRLIKVSDFFPVGQEARKIVYAVDRKKRPNRFKARAPYQILEVIEPGAEFAGVISIFSPVKRGVVRNPLTRDELLRALKMFYGSEKTRENKDLSLMGVNTVEMEREIPIRIGRHSGAESVTVEGYRKIKITKGRGPASYLDHATTIWMASGHRHPSGSAGLQPFGWMAFAETDQDSWEKYTAGTDALRDLVYREVEKNLLENAMLREDEAAKKAEEAKRLEEKRKKEADPIYQRQKKLADFERCLPDGASLPGQAAAIIEAMKEMEDHQLRRQAAESFRRRYKTQIKKAQKRGKPWVLKFQALVDELES